jgi:3'(2'), 5'-bisphosphate nucleotidase
MHHLLTSIHAAIEAGSAILQVYRSSDFEVEQKADKSPLTLADRNAHVVIMQHLLKFDIPVLSEEGKSIPYNDMSRLPASSLCLIKTCCISHPGKLAPTGWI